MVIMLRLFLGNMFILLILLMIIKLYYFDNINNCIGINYCVLM